MSARIAPIRPEIAQIVITRREKLPPDLELAFQVYRRGRIDPIASSRWLVLPSRQMVLWECEGDDNFLPLPSLRGCIYGPNWHSCVGAVLSPAGKFQ